MSARSTRRFLTEKCRIPHSSAERPHGISVETKQLKINKMTHPPQPYVRQKEGASVYSFTRVYAPRLEGGSLWRRHPARLQDQAKRGIGEAYRSQARAEAPRMAASDSLSWEYTSWTLFFQRGRTLSFIERRIGSVRNSLLLARPPKRTMASGEENAMKSAKAWPRRVPVYSKILMARASPSLAAS